ncbi:carbohydrate esterase family 16 protein [Panus rudis PR-1116 ss-1]|nr:carbohydrate esterase family 16 protein [Panus rudis PR-1116 ss-1]
MRVLSIASTVLASIQLAFAVGPSPNQIKNLVTFGDSYTDTVATGDGGVAWPDYAAGYSHTKLFPFAKSGATCSNNLTFRAVPSIREGQLPLLFQELRNGSLRLSPEETMYTLWIGTNDVGILLTGEQATGVTVVDTVSCAVDWVSTLYANGARNFIFQNMIPLQDTILYSPNSYPNRFWDLPRNTTEWSLTMTELTTSGNEIAKLMLQDLAPKLHGAHLGLFDSHGLFTDMLNHPQNYLNGTAPLNVTGAVRSCVFELNTGVVEQCTIADGTDRDSFLWFDELHPSEQADRHVAREIANSIRRKDSRWITWLS